MEVSSMTDRGREKQSSFDFSVQIVPTGAAAEVESSLQGLIEERGKLSSCFNLSKTLETI